MNNNRCVVLFGTFINAYGIYRSVRESGFNGNIYVIEAVKPKYNKNLIELATKDIQIIHKLINSSQDVVDLFEKFPEKYKSVFFTAEDSMDYVRIAIEKGLVKNVTAFTGAGIGNDYVFDKYKFYCCINENKLGNAPKTVSSREDPEKVFGKSYVVRPKRSWVGGISTPRITIVQNALERKEIEYEYKKLGMRREDWCYQELLSIKPEDNISVIGWYEKGIELFYAYKKLVRFPENNGTGCIIEIIKDIPENPICQTRNILNFLKYEGPFEIEFLYDFHQNNYKPIDFNPRFWMQHELIEKTSDYFMIRRTLGENVKPKKTEKYYYKYWINTNQILYKILTGHVKLFKYFRGAIKAPGFIVSFKWIIYTLYSALKNKKQRKEI